MVFSDFLILPDRRFAASAPLRRWRIAYHMISSCCAMCILVGKQLAAIRWAPSYVAIDVDGDYASLTFSKVADASSLRPLVKERRLEDLHRLGGPAGLVSALASDAEAGIEGGGDDLSSRKAAFGSNTYPRPKPKRFFHFVFEAINDLFIIILMVCAAISLAFGIKEHGIKDGWYDGASIFLGLLHDKNDEGQRHGPEALCLRDHGFRHHHLHR